MLLLLTTPILFILFEPYTLTISLFERALAFHNFLAFASFYGQWRGLIGSKGLAPAKELMNKLKQRGWTWKTRWKSMPTLVWYSDDDWMLNAIQVVGLVTSALAFFGIFTGINILIACICYSSIKCVGSVFTQLQMHAHIMEIDLIYVACAPFLHVAPSALVILASLLNFRVMMGGGAGKWFGGDKSWKNGTAMAWHYWTQPLPNPLSPFMHRLPLWIHKVETYASMIFESGAALFVFAPVYLRFIAFFCFMSLMLGINLTGNFAQISVLTMNESLLLLNDNWWNSIFYGASFFIPGLDYLRRWFVWAYSVPYLDLALPASSKVYSLWNFTFGLVPYICFILPYAFIQLIPLIGTFRGHNALEIFEGYSPKPMQWYRSYLQSETYAKHIKPKWNKVWNYMEKGFVYGNIFDIFSSYVKFGHMTKFRHEIIIESSLDGITWQEYTFKFKPSLVTKTPPFCPGHLPAMDWRLWFLPLEFARGSEPPMWFLRILMRLLECEPCVMDLFLSCPYDGKKTPKPKFIRAVLYDYRFAYKYEQEDDMKRLAKEYKIRDTEIDTSSEEEVEVPIEQEKAEQQKIHGHEVKRDMKPDATHPLEEEKTRDAVDEKQAMLRQRKPESSGPQLAEEEDTKKATQQPQSESTRTQPTATSSDVPSMSHDDEDAEEEEEDDDEEEEEEDTESREHRLARETLERLLGISLPSQARRPHRRRPKPGHIFKRIRKVTSPVDQRDSSGNKVWYVRRHRIGPYGPTLTVRQSTPTPPNHFEGESPAAAAAQSATTNSDTNWEEYLED